MGNNGLGQFTRNYTQTTKRGLLTTKQAEYQAPEKCEIFSLFCCSGFPKGLASWSRHQTLCRLHLLNCFFPAVAVMDK